MKRKILLLSFLAVMSALCLSLFNFLTFSEDQYANDITPDCTVFAEGFTNSSLLWDQQAQSGAFCKENGQITIEAEEEIGALYLRFNSDPVAYTVISEETQYIGGQEGYLHEYINIKKHLGSAHKLTLYFHSDFEISELTVFSAGKRPPEIQVWKPSLTQADLLLYAAHSDDDQLFFAGVIPKYVAADYKVQVAYLTYHPDWACRRHELLDGLWAAGCEYYPIYGKFADFRIDDLKETVAEYQKKGTAYVDLEGFIVETTRKTKPLVIVSHDPKGEYGHGMHQLLSKMVRDHLPLCGDARAYPSSAKEYGTWIVPKTYLHLYEENQIVLNIDEPLERFSGKSAFQVSQESFLKCHTSQHGGWYFKWQQGTPAKPVKSSTELEIYNPAFYGLYESTVGADTAKNDFFENLLSYAEQREKQEADKLKEEQQAQQNKEELSELQEEFAKLKEELLEKAEEEERLKEELNALEETIDALGDDKEGLEKELAAQQKKSTLLLCVLSVLALSCSVLVGYLLIVHKKTNKE